MVAGGPSSAGLLVAIFMVASLMVAGGPWSVGLLVASLLVASLLVASLLVAGEPWSAGLAVKAETQILRPNLVRIWPFQFAPQFLFSVPPVGIAWPIWPRPN
jgi:hypothetical protein